MSAMAKSHRIMRAESVMLSMLNDQIGAPGLIAPMPPTVPPFDLPRIFPVPPGPIRYPRSDTPIPPFPNLPRQDVEGSDDSDNDEDGDDQRDRDKREKKTVKFCDNLVDKIIFMPAVRLPCWRRCFH